MLPLIFDILIRFRCYNYALISDIKSAFLNIRVNPNDRDYLRYLWVEDITDPNSKIVIFRFTSVLYGKIVTISDVSNNFEPYEEIFTFAS